MAEEALPLKVPRRLGRYEVVGGLAIRSTRLRSTIVIATPRSASPAGPGTEIGSGLALSYSPAGPDEGTTTFQRPVAIKRIAPELVGNAEALTTFLDRARAVIGIRHSNVVRIVEVGQVDTDVFLVMDYVPGETAATLMRQLHSRGETLGFKLAAHIIAEACAGLDAGHALGILHERLTPHDLFIGYDGKVRVLDIGIAAARGRLAAELETGEVGLEYGSPERCKKEMLDRRSDVFSLGAMLWELVTGLSPFERAKGADMIRAICEEPVVPPGSVLPGLPEQVSTITMKALERDKAQRYQTTLKLRQALLDLRQSTGGGASPVGDLSKLMKRLFATRVRDKAEMLKRINLAASIKDLDVAEPEMGEAPKSEAPIARSEPLPLVVSATTSPHKSNPPELVEYKEPSVIITSPDAVTPALAETAAPVAAPVAAAPFGFDEGPVAAASPRRPRRSVVPFVVGVLLLVLLVGGGALAVGFALRKPNASASSSPTKVAPAPTPALPVAASATASALSASDVPALPAISPTAAATSATSATATTVEETELHIETVPSRATILVAGTKKGVSPLDLKLPKGHEAVTIEIRRAGFQTLKERVVPDVNQRLKLTLLVARDRATGGAGTAEYHKFE